MAITWTPERRQWRAELTRQQKPWLHSTGPKTAAGKAKVSRNAYKGGNRQFLREAIRTLKRQDWMLMRIKSL